MPAYEGTSIIPPIRTVTPADLQTLGLSEREFKIYLALVSRNGTLPTEIPALSSVPISKVYETLRHLLELGLVVEMPATGRRRYQAVPPDQAVERLLAQQHAEYERKREAGAYIAERLRPLYEAQHDGPNPFDYFTAMKNPAQIIRRFNELQADAHEEVLSFAKAPYYMNPQNINQVELDALERGVKYRAIYEICDAVNPAMLTAMQPYIKAGEQARVHPNLAIKLAVFDRKISLFQLVDPRSPQHRTTLVIEHPGMALAFVECFEKCWLEATDLAVFLETRGMSK